MCGPATPTSPPPSPSPCWHRSPPRLCISYPSISTAGAGACVCAQCALWCVCLVAGRTVGRSVGRSIDRAGLLVLLAYLQQQRTTTNSVSAASRLAEVNKGYFSVCSGRILRIIPAFGLGGFINDMIKESFEDEEEAMFLHMDQPPVASRGRN